MGRSRKRYSFGRHRERRVRRRYVGGYL